MDIVKKNLLSIICGGVALIALLAVFVWPIPGMVSGEDGLEAKLNRSAAYYEDLRRLNSQRFPLPNPDPEKADANSLEAGRFPTAELIRDAEKCVNTVRKQSLQLVKEALTHNKKAPLYPNALPAWNGNAAARFKELYYAALREFHKDLNAAAPPTQAELERVRDARWQKYLSDNLIGGGDKTNKEALVKEFNEQVVPKLPDELRRERAQRFTMYLADRDQPTNQIGFGRAPAMSSGGAAGLGLDYYAGIPPEQSPDNPNVVQIWIAQLSLWIQQDVVQAIAATNGAARGVENAVIKRLVRIDIPKNYVTRKGKVSIETALGGGRASFVPAGGALAPTGSTETVVEEGTGPVYGAACTGRVCNSTYDVMHFTVTVDADAARFREFIANLTARKFITILGIDVKAVDIERAYQAGFVYGNKPVVQLTLRCEVLFLREWTVGGSARQGLMPQDVRNLLNVSYPEGRHARND